MDHLRLSPASSPAVSKESKSSSPGVPAQGALGHRAVSSGAGKPDERRGAQAQAPTDGGRTGKPTSARSATAMHPLGAALGPLAHLHGAITQALPELRATRDRMVESSYHAEVDPNQGRDAQLVAQYREDASSLHQELARLVKLPSAHTFAKSAAVLLEPDWQERLPAGVGDGDWLRLRLAVDKIPPLLVRANALAGQVDLAVRSDSKQSDHPGPSPQVFVAAMVPKQAMVELGAVLDRLHVLTGTLGRSLAALETPG